MDRLVTVTRSGVDWLRALGVLDVLDTVDILEWWVLELYPKVY